MLSFLSVSLLETYLYLCEQKQSDVTATTQRYVRHLEEAIRDKKKKRYAAYSVIEILRILAPKNCFAEETIEEVFSYIAEHASSQKEGPRALQTVASYKMAALIDSPGIINALCMTALNHLSRSWSLDIIRSVIEEKDEVLGKEVKQKLVQHAAEKNSPLHSVLASWPQLFTEAVREHVEKTEKKVVLIKHFNVISKDLLTQKLLACVLQDPRDRKDLLQFLQGSTVRREVLFVIRELEEDRSAAIRSAVPFVLLRKAADPFYTTWVSAQIKKEAVEIWKKRTRDSSQTVRLYVFKHTQYRDIGDPNALEEVLSASIMDVSYQVRVEVLRLIKEAYVDALNNRAYPKRKLESCFMCRGNSGKVSCLVPLLSSACIPEYKEQTDLLKEFLGYFSLQHAALFAEEILQEIYAYSVQHPEKADSIKIVTGVLAFLEYRLPDMPNLSDSVTENSEIDTSQVCNEHKPAVAAITKLLGRSETEISSASELPPSLVIPLAEKYLDFGIPFFLFSRLDALLETVPRDIFYQIARIITVTEAVSALGWAEIRTRTKEVEEYTEVKGIATAENTNASKNSLVLNLSDITEQEEDPKHAPAENEHTTRYEASWRLLQDADPNMLLMVMLDLITVSVRSQALEEACIRALLSESTAEQFSNTRDSLFTAERLIFLIRNSRNTEERILLCAIQTLLSPEKGPVLDAESLGPFLHYLCWVFVQYDRSRATEIIRALFLRQKPQVHQFFAVSVNLKRFSVRDAGKQRDLYVLSEEMHALVEKEASKIGINPSQFANDLPETLQADLRDRGGWAAFLEVLNDAQYSSNLLTNFRSARNVQE